MSPVATPPPLHPKDAEVIKQAIGRFLDAGIDRFGEAGFIDAIQIYMLEQVAR